MEDRPQDHLSAPRSSGLPLGYFPPSFRDRCAAGLRRLLSALGFVVCTVGIAFAMLSLALLAVLVGLLLSQLF